MILKYSFLLQCVLLSINGFSIDQYTPSIADPMVEEWRYAYFPELDGKGIRSIGSVSEKNEYWFGLDSGIVAYDGYNWTYYTQKDGLDGTPVQKVFVDNQDRIYAATSSGLFKFGKNKWTNIFKTKYNANFEFKSIKQLQSGSIICGTTAGAIFLNNDKKILLSTKNKWNALEEALPGFSFVEIPSTLLLKNTFDNVSDIFEVSEGQLWLAVTYQLEDEKGDIMMFSENEILTQEVVNYNLLSRYYDIQLGYEQSIFRASNDNIWIINKSNKLPTLRFANGRWQAIAYGEKFGDDEYSESILETENNKIWISGIGNLYCLDASGKWTKYNSETLNIPHAHIKLHSGNLSDLWVFGYRSTVYRVDISYDKYLTYLDINYQCEQKDGTSWFIDFDGNVISNDINNNLWTKTTTREKLIDNPVSLFVATNNTVWALGSDKGVASAGYYTNGNWVNFVFDSLSWGIDYRAIHETSDGSIWFGGCTDVYLDEGQTGGLAQIKNPYSEKPQVVYHRARTNGLNQLNAYGISQTSDGKIWIGGSRLYYFNGNTWESMNNSDLNGFVNEVHNDQNGTLYVGSRQHGLSINNQDNWENYSIQNGLLSNNIISIATNNTNNEIWLATDKDFSFFNGSAWTNNVFPNELTLSYEGGTIKLNQHNEIWISRSLREWKRRVYTGKSPEKAIRDKFTSHRFIKDTTPPETAIESYVKTVDKSGNTTIFWSGRHYLNKISAAKLFYSYRLNDNEWSQYSKRLNHTFTGLDNGDYTFEVRAMDTNGNIDSSPATVKFTVIPPVWKQVWFILLIFSFLIVIGIFQYLILKKRETLKRLNDSLQIANSALETKNLQVQTQKDSLEEMVKKIDDLSKAKMRFFTNITHEFRTPLSLILGPIEKLESEAPNDSTLHSFYSLIKKNTLRLQKLINQLLEIRKIETGTLDLQLSENDIVTFVKDVKNLFNNQATDQNINFSFQSDFEKLTIFFDQDKIEKILFNLLSNAFKHTPKNGSINIKILQSEKYLMKDGDLDFIRLIVEDNGTGLDEKLLNNLFERFTVGHNEVSFKNGENSGIGLSYIKDLIESHKGNIKVESEAGKGTIFTVYLPDNLHESTPKLQLPGEKYDPKFSIDASILSIESQRVNTNENQLPKKEGCPTILIVEDNEDMRFFINSLLKQHYNVLTACNGQEGLEILDKAYVDLIISDIMMPKVDGITFCQKIKSSQATSHMPIILLTALTIDNQRISGYESGADSYMVKPFKPELLQARIQNLLNSREVLKQKYADDLRFKPKDVMVTSVDEEFLNKLSSLMEENISDSQFDVSTMCEMTNMSHMHFIRKVKQLTGKKPIDLLKSFRLARAKQLLGQNKINVSEIGYMVGYDLPNSFTRAFKNEFGVSPTKFVLQETEKKQ